ncbi:hypothetical protein GBA52_000064 [Prunus armeniaca]|nr:hypothetical protein GBA52_000064 [Prunus armeniaca]
MVIFNQQWGKKSRWRIEGVDVVDLEEVAAVLAMPFKFPFSHGIEQSVKLCCDSITLLELVVSERQNTKVERYSDRLKPKTTIRSGALFVILELKGFPQELTGDLAQQSGRKRVRWNPDLGPMRLILCFSVVLFNLLIMMEKKRKKVKVRMKMNKKRRRRQKKTSVMMIIRRTKISMMMMMILIWKMMVMMNLFCSETVLHMRLLQTYTNLPHFSSTKWSIQLSFVFL